MIIISRLLASFLIIFFVCIAALSFMGTATGIQLLFKFTHDYIPGKLDMTNLRGSLWQGLTIEHAIYEDKEVIVDLDQVTIKLNPWGLFSHQAFDIENLHAQKMHLILKDPNPFENVAFLKPLNKLPISIHVILQKGRLDNFTLQIVPDAPITDVGELNVQAHTTPGHLFIERLYMKNDIYDAYGHGRFTPKAPIPLELTGHWRVHFNDEDKLGGTITAVGDFTQLKLTQFFDMPTNVFATGKLFNLDTKPTWQLNASIENKLLSNFHPVLPDSLLNGILTLNGALRTPQVFQFKGTAQQAQSPLFNANFQVDYQDLQFIFKSMTLETTEKKSSLYLTGLIDLHTPTKIFTKTKLHQFNPDLLWQNWPGTLNSELNLDFIFHDQGETETILDLKSLQGTLRSYPIQGKGQMQFTLPSFETLDGQITLALGKNELLFNSKKKNQQWQADWKINAPHLAQFLPDIEGILTAQGNIHGSLQEPHFISKINVDKFRWQTLPSMDFGMEMDIQPAKTQAQLTLKHLDIHTNAFKKMHLQPHGNAQFNWGPSQTSGELLLQLWKNAVIKANLQAPAMSHFSLATLKQLPMDININTDIQQLTPLETLFLDISELKGQVSGQWHWQGSLQKPSITGQLALKNAGFIIPKINLEAKKIELLAYKKIDTPFLIDGHANLGQGQLKIKGKIPDISALKGIDLQITGSNLQIANTAQWHIFASPNLKFNYENNLPILSGRIDVPKANIALRDFSNVVTTSDDIIKVHEQETEKEAPFAIHTDLLLALGDQVYFKGFNLKAMVGGAVQVLRIPGQNITRAKGEFNLKNAQYQLYGKELTLNKSRLFYSNSDLSNPYLDLKTERKVNIKSNKTTELRLLDTPQYTLGENSTEITDEMIAGKVSLQVNGTLDKPEIVLSSTPWLSDTDRLSYLLLGVPSTDLSSAQGQILASAAKEIANSMGLFQQDEGSVFNKVSSYTGLDVLELDSSTALNQETGLMESQTALVVGKDVLPNLHVNYSVGLLYPVNSLEVKLKLNDDWSFQTNLSNEGETGGDLIYQIETDG